MKRIVLLLLLLSTFTGHGQQYINDLVTRNSTSIGADPQNRGNIRMKDGKFEVNINGKWVDQLDSNKNYTDIKFNAVASGSGNAIHTTVPDTNIKSYFALDTGSYASFLDTSGAAIHVYKNDLDSGIVMIHKLSGYWYKSVQRQNLAAYTLNGGSTKTLFQVDSQIGLSNILLLEKSISTCTDTATNLTRTWIFNLPFPDSAILKEVTLFCVVPGNVALCEFVKTGDSVTRVNLKVVTLSLGFNHITDFTCKVGNYIGFITSETTYPGRVGFSNSTSAYQVYPFTFAVGTKTALTPPQTTQRFGIQLSVKDKRTIDYRLSSVQANKVGQQTGTTFDRQTSTEKLFYDADFAAPYLTDQKTDFLGQKKYVERAGMNTAWAFAGSLALDSISKSSALVTYLNSETYTTGVSYKLDVALHAGQSLPYLLINQSNSLNSLNYSQEILEFTLDRFTTNSYVGILYAGQTLYSRKLGHMFAFWPNIATSNVQQLRIYTTEGLNTASFITNNTHTLTTTSTVGDSYRMVHNYNGHSQSVYFYKKVGGNYVFVDSIMTVYGDGRNRPSNRKYAIAFRDIGVTITKYETYSYEPYRVRLMFIGHSIPSGFSTTDLDSAYSRKAIQWNGIGGTVRCASGTTTEDWLQMMPELLDRHPETVIFDLGLNDKRYNVPNFESNYQEMVRQFDSIGAKIILCEPIPNNDDDIVPFKNWLHATYDGVYPIVPLYKALEDPNNAGKLSPSDSPDGTHLNDIGSSKAFKIIKQYL